MGVFRPIPQVGGVQPATIPAPPKDVAVKVRVLKLPTAGKSLPRMVGTLLVVTPFSSTISDSSVAVWFCVMLSEVVGEPAGSPCKCNRITTGMQVLKGILAGLELTLDTEAKMPVRPGVAAVARPFTSTLATDALVLAQVTGPATLVISLAFGAHGPDESGGVTRVEHTWAVNCWVCVLEVQPAMLGVTITDVTL